MSELSPVDVCGCGDTGYLTLRTIPIDLAQGAGHIHQVPVYHCGSKLCDQYHLPSSVAVRLDDLAEIMEQKNLNSLPFSWEEQEESSQDSLSILEAFLWKFFHRRYEDATVMCVIPGQSIVFRSEQDSSEYYQLKYLLKDEKGIWFSFLKFYSDELLTAEEFPDFEPTYAKELGVIALDDVEEMLLDEFGMVI